MSANRHGFTAVVFDLDGTLVNSMPLVLRGYAHALAPCGVSLSEAELLGRLGGPPERFFHELLADRAAATAALDRLEAFFHEHAELIQPFDGAAPLLDRLRAAGLRLGIWTGRERASAEWIMREHGLAPRIDASVFGDELATHKPDPEGLDTVTGRLGATRATTLFVGDADVDVLAGAAAGVRTLLIRHGRHVAPAVQAKAWRIVETPAEAYALIGAELAPV